jgi:hypothetical protein
LEKVFFRNKRGMIDRINIDSELSRLFDTLFEYEGIVLKNRSRPKDNLT